MIRNTCPFLGLKDDPETALNFASEGNFCHRALPVTQIKGAYQQKYCLTGNHVNCPLFQAARPIPPPAAMAANSGVLATPRRKWIVLGGSALLASSAALFLAWSVFGAQLHLSNPLIPNTGETPQSPAAFSIIAAPAIQKPSLALSQTPAPTQEPIPTQCVQPDGWVPYMVNPTDSLYRLSVVYGVSIEELQRVNCMGQNTLLKPSDIILVPDLPTPTPTLTPTLTAVPPTRTRVPQRVDPVQPPPSQDDSGDEVAEPPTANPPTAVPPTNVPPTDVPPTDVPAQPEPTSAPGQKPPEEKPPEEKPSQEKPSEQKPPEVKPPEQKPPEVKPPDKNEKPPKDNPPPSNNDSGDKKPKGNDKKDNNNNNNDKGKGKKNG